MLNPFKHWVNEVYKRIDPDLKPHFKSCLKKNMIWFRGHFDKETSIEEMASFFKIPF